MKRIAVAAMTTGLILAAAVPASASVLDERCGIRWKADDSQALRWCIAVNYNDLTGEIEGSFHYSDNHTGNVYAVYVRNIRLWRQTPDGDIWLKDDCGACPTWEFVYDDWNNLDTGWSDYLCNRNYWADVIFQVQWDWGGPITDPITRLSDSVSLC